MRLLVDGVEIPWPKKIEIQVDEAGETVGPLYVEFSGGQLVVQGNIEHDAALTLIGSLPDGSYREEFLILREHGWRPEMGGRLVWDGDKLVPADDLSNANYSSTLVSGFDNRTKTVTLADPVEDLPTPDVVAREGEPC